MNNKFEDKVINNQIDKLTLKEIDSYIDKNFDIWACKFELSPCGHLTLTGKRSYINGYIEEVKELIEFNRKYPNKGSQNQSMEKQK